MARFASAVVVSLFAAGCGAGSSTQAQPASPAIIYINGVGESTAAPAAAPKPKFAEVAVDMCPELVNLVPQKSAVEAGSASPLSPGYECLHMVAHFVNEGESLARRPTGKDEETTIRGVRDYLTALAKLDREHPQFHGKLKDRIAAVSLTAARSRHTMFTAGRDDVKDVMALQADIAALYDYCDPLILY